MLARIVVYLYVVLMGVAFLLEQPAELALAIASLSRSAELVRELRPARAGWATSQANGQDAVRPGLSIPNSSTRPGT